MLDGEGVFRSSPLDENLPANASLITDTHSSLTDNTQLLGNNATETAPIITFFSPTSRQLFRGLRLGHACWIYLRILAQRSARRRGKRNRALRGELPRGLPHLPFRQCTGLAQLDRFYPVFEDESPFPPLWASGPSSKPPH